MLLPATQLLAASMSPGAVAAPSWFLPVAAACTGLLPACMIPVVKGMERNRQEWVTNAPAKDSGFVVANPSAFCVMEAGDKGNGLFATEYVPKGTYLFDYTGELLSKLEYDVRYPNRVSDYCAALRDPATGTMHFVDGKDEELGHPSRWMNHDDREPNVGRRSFFPADGSQPRILMYALDDLFLGDELQWNYGAGYWQAHEDQGMKKVETE